MKVDQDPVLICVVLYNRGPSGSLTLASLAELWPECQATLVIHNNGPTHLKDEDRAWLRQAFPLADVRVRETLSNSSLAEVYNHVIASSARAYAFLDQDSLLSAEYVQTLVASGSQDVIVPRIQTPGLARNPKYRGRVVSDDCTLEPFLGGLRTITSGLILGADFTRRFGKHFGKVFDERYRLYGVDTSFFLRLDKYSRIAPVSVAVSGTIRHSLSRLEKPEEGALAVFRATERGYDLGITLRNYFGRSSIANLIREALKTTLSRGGISWSAFVKGYLGGQHPLQDGGLPPDPLQEGRASDNVTFVEPKLDVYGGQHALIQRCIYLRDHTNLGFEIVHTTSSSRFYSTAVRAGLGKNIRLVGEKSHSRIFKLFAVAWHLGRSQPRIVHLDGFDSCYLACALKAVRLLRSYLIFTVRSDRYNHFKWWDKLLLSYVDELVTNSEYSRGQILKSLGRDALVHYSPIDLERILEEVRATESCVDSHGKVVVAYVGSIEPRKRVDFFIRVANIIASRSDRFVFHIYGQAKDKSGSELLSSSLKAVGAKALDRIIIKGYTPISVAIAETDILVCPFIDEPLGRVVPEFLYAGRRVIVADSGGLEEAGCGFAEVFTHNDEEACAEIIMRDVRAQRLEIMRNALRERFSPMSCGRLDYMLYNKALRISNE